MAILVAAPPLWAQAADATAVTLEEPEEAQLLVIAPQGGIGKFNETTVEQDDAVWSAGLGVRWHPDIRNRIAGEFLIQGYTREYIQTGAGSPGLSPRVAEDELRIEGGLNWGYNVLWAVRDDLGLWPYVGWRHIYFTNDRFAENLSGVVAGAVFDWTLTEDFTFSTFVDYTYNLASIIDSSEAAPASVTGDTLSSLRWGGGVRIVAGEQAEIGLSYVGEHLPHDNTDLFFHKAVLEIGVPIRF